MSALGQKRTSDCRPLMSALPPKAEGHGGNGSGPDDVGVWRPRSLCRFHLPRRRTTQAARLTLPITYPQARGLAGMATTRDHRLGRRDFRLVSKADMTV